MKKEPFNQPSEVGQKVNIKEKWEQDYWSNRLHTTPSKLINVIKKVGDSLGAIKKELNK